MQVILQVLLQVLFLCAIEEASAALHATLGLIFQHLWLIRQKGQSWRRASTMACPAAQFMVPLTQLRTAALQHRKQAAMKDATCVVVQAALHNFTPFLARDMA